MEWLQEAFAAYSWGIYLVVFIGPFIQEDAAIVGAAAASAGGAGDPTAIFTLLLIGLVLSDVWKYWAGRYAVTHPKVRHYAEKPRVLAFKDRIFTRLGLSLLTVRFVPGTRIPFYLAAGFFKAPFPKFIIILCSTALLYVTLAFALFHFLGMALGEEVRQWMPLAVIVIVLVMVGIEVVKHRRAGDAP
ncbi:MAG: hypothetical protein R3C13_07840 [Hyphomonas sp.]|uniref:DedA family protein n=1 Tax=Hyphomonas sp. TaxID=87 RepID=UPI0035297519